MTNETQSPSLQQAYFSSCFVYLITNETDGIVESAWSNFQEAMKECQKWEKMKPQKEFMVVKLPINGGHRSSTGPIFYANNLNVVQGLGENQPRHHSAAGTILKRK